MKRSVLWPVIVFVAAVSPFGPRFLPAGGRAAGAAEDGQKAAFPRLDGVYRIARRTTLVGQENRVVYDYVVFTKKGVAYTIKGAYGLPAKEGDYYLEQPTGEPGCFHALSVPLKDQPAFIMRWLADPKEKQPLGSKYQVKQGLVSFDIRNPGSPFERAYTISYRGLATERGIKMVETSTANRRAKPAERVYEFEPAR
jgi:hypothetical protein